MKKLIKIMLVIIVVLVSNFVILANTVKAVENETIHLYQTGSLNKILKFKGILIKTTHVVYDKNGKQYPAYCLNVELPGIESGEYEVVNQGKINDLGLWRVIINAYPYKTLEELGVASEEEAYIASKQAIYCYLQNRGTENYSAVNEAGQRTLNAINMILLNASNSTENMEMQQIEINQSEEWKVEEQYISKEYKIKANIDSYIIQLENQPENTIITDIQNNQKNEFNSDEKFKILIPIKSLQKSGEFKINIKTQIETKPVFFGKAPNEQVQNYALTAYTFEDISTELVQQYNKNETQIIIEKQDEITQEQLEGAKFEVLDENKKVIQTLITNEDGIIKIKDILPGKYYIREIEAPEGYEINDELIQIEVNLNEQKNVVVQNQKIEIIEETPIIEEKLEPVEEIRKLPVTGM